MSSGWYSQVKKADASVGQGPEGYQGSDGVPALDRERTIQYLDYSVKPPFDVGDEVRERRGGIGEQVEPSRGRVVHVGGNHMKVEWEHGKRKGKTTDFSLMDAARLSMTLEKVR